MFISKRSSPLWMVLKILSIYKKGAAGPVILYPHNRSLYDPVQIRSS